MKICIACSSGGHLTEILQIREVFDKRKNFFITFKRKDSEELTKKENVYFVSDPKRNPVLLIVNIFY